MKHSKLHAQEQFFMPLSDEEAELIKDADWLRLVYEALPSRESFSLQGLQLITTWEIGCDKCHSLAMQLIAEWQLKWALYLARGPVSTHTVYLYGLSNNMPGSVRSAEALKPSEDDWGFRGYDY